MFDQKYPQREIESSSSEESLNKSEKVKPDGKSETSSRQPSRRPSQHPIAGLLQNDERTFQGKKSILGALFNSNGAYDGFLQFSSEEFQTPAMVKEFQVFKCSNINASLTLLMIFLNSVFVILRANLELVFTSNRYPIFQMTVFCAAVTVVLSVTITFTRAATSSYQNDILFLQKYAAVSSKFMDTFYGKLIEDAVALFAISSTSLDVLGRVLIGECPVDSTAWQLQSCNTAADGHTIPSEQLLLSCILLLLIQVFIRGCSRTGLACSWAIHIIAINGSLWIVTADAYYWVCINILLVFLVSLSYEVERLTVCRFIQEKTAQASAQKLHQFKLAKVNETISVGRRDLESKRSMVRHISNEIRTPLNTASIGVEVLGHELSKLGTLLPLASIELVDGIKSACGTALTIVNELLAYETLAAGLSVLDLGAIQVKQFVRDAVKEFSILSDAKDITLHVDMSLLCEDSTTVFIDPVKMKYVMRNFLSNAVKFTPQEGVIRVSLHNTVSKCESIDCVVISVEDSGAGLSAENIENLFQEGVQFNANTLQNGGGSGFGLFIAKGISDLHKGCSIWATSPGEGKGCTFSLELPLMHRIMPGLQFTTTFCNKRGSVSSDDVDRLSTRSTTSELSLCSSDMLMILVVDDSQPVRKEMMKYLNAAGHNCVAAEDGVSAVREISLMLMKREGDDLHTQYDAVLMDSSMPKMNGPEATREMRRLGFMGAIIGINGHNDPTEFNDAGADMVMVKPLKTHAITKDILSALSKRRFNLVGHESRKEEKI